EYYFQTREVLAKDIQAYEEHGTRAEVVRELETSLFEIYNNPELGEKPKELEERGGAFYSNVACSLMDSIHNDKKDIQTVNTLNNGAIPSLPNDAVIEVNCVITKHGPKPVSVGELPNAVKGYIYQMKAFEELVIQAAVSGDYHDAYLSFTMNQFIEIAGRIGAQRHLLAVRDGFIAIMPLIIIGSFAVLINNFPPIGKFDFVGMMNNVFGEEKWQMVGGSIWNGTFAILGLLIAFSIAYQLAKSYDVDGLPAGFIALASYIAFAPETPDDWGLDFAWLGAQGIFIAIILGIVVAELFRILIQSRLTIKMPDGVPAGVEKSFKALIPTIIILVLVGLIQALMNAFSDSSIFELVFEII